MPGSKSARCGMNPSGSLSHMASGGLEADDADISQHTKAELTFEFFALKVVDVPKFNFLQVVTVFHGQ